MSRTGSVFVRTLVTAALVIVLTGACADVEEPDIATDTTSLWSAATTAPETSADSLSVLTGGAAAYDGYPDAALRRMWLRMQEPRPVEGSAMPPKHLNAAWFPDSLVDRSEIVSGGPPPDGIPSIDDPEFASIGDIDEIEPQEAVLVFEHRGDTRIYPVRIMTWHEIVNDVVGGDPITVTFCPLCNSALAFVRTVDGRVFDFGTSGYLYRSGMVMYDRQTESLWTHFDGRAVIGAEIGTELVRLPIATVSWEQARSAHPDALVLRGDPLNPKPYGTNRYVGYDQNDEPLAGWFDVDIPEPIPPMTRVVGVRTADAQVAVPTSLVAERGVVKIEIDGVDVVVFHVPGTASPLQRRSVAAGDDIGSTGVFDSSVDGTNFTFRSVDGRVVDAETGSTWDIRGRAIIGPMVGAKLKEVEHLDTFWFAWIAHHPRTQLLT